MFTFWLIRIFNRYVFKNIYFILLLRVMSDLFFLLSSFLCWVLWFSTLTFANVPHVLRSVTFAYLRIVFWRFVFILLSLLWTLETFILADGPFTFNPMYVCREICGPLIYFLRSTCLLKTLLFTGMRWKPLRQWLGLLNFLWIIKYFPQFICPSHWGNINTH